MSRSRVIRCCELTKTKGACQAAFPALSLRPQPNPGVSTVPLMAHELRTPRLEQAYGCENTNVETVAGDSGICRTLQPASPAPVSRVILNPNPLAHAPRRRAQAKAEHPGRPAGPHGHPVPGENQSPETRTCSGGHAPHPLTAALRHTTLALPVPRRCFRTTSSGHWLELRHFGLLSSTSGRKLHP
jgi:hypothetical protein